MSFPVTRAEAEANINSSGIRLAVRFTGDHGGETLVLHDLRFDQAKSLRDDLNRAMAKQSALAAIFHRFRKGSRG